VESSTGRKDAEAGNLYSLVLMLKWGREVSGKRNTARGRIFVKDDTPQTSTTNGLLGEEIRMNRVVTSKRRQKAGAVTGQDSEDEKGLITVVPRRR